MRPVTAGSRRRRRASVVIAICLPILAAWTVVVLRPSLFPKSSPFPALSSSVGISLLDPRVGPRTRDDYDTTVYAEVGYTHVRTLQLFWSAPFYCEWRWSIAGYRRIEQDGKTAQVRMTVDDCAEMVKLNESILRKEFCADPAQSHLWSQWSFPGSVALERTMTNRETSFHLSEISWPGVAATFAIIVGSPWTVMASASGLLLGVAGLFRARQIETWACVYCGYDMRGIGGLCICPECGQSNAVETKRPSRIC